MLGHSIPFKPTILSCFASIFYLNHLSPSNIVYFVLHILLICTLPTPEGKLYGHRNSVCFTSSGPKIMPCRWSINIAFFLNFHILWNDYHNQFNQLYYLIQMEKKKKCFFLVIRTLKISLNYVQISTNNRHHLVHYIASIYNDKFVPLTTFIQLPDSSINIAELTRRHIKVLSIKKKEWIV